MKVNECTVHELEIVYKPKFQRDNLEKITNSLGAANLLRKSYNENTIECQEEVIVLFLDNANHVIGLQKLSKGGVSSTVVDTRLILSVALKSLASGIILSHNHPSGNLVPSEVDKKITQQLKDACKLLEITLLDHIIIAPGTGYYSFTDDNAH
jgi:DNA repair protein RadC